MEIVNYGKMGERMVVRLVLFFVVFLFSRCTFQKIEYVEIENSIELSSNSNTIAISNPTNKELSFSLNINDFFPLHEEKMIDDIVEYASRKDKEIEEAAFDYVRTTTFSNRPFTSDNWQHNPNLFFNSIGGGFCDDQATMLVYLWRKLGFEARVVGLEGHVVAEVKTNGRWKMYDPNHQVYYCIDDSVLSISDLEKIDTYNYQMTCSQSNLNPVYTFNTPLFQKQKELYVSREDNKDVSEWHLDFDTISTVFSLPSYSSLEFIKTKKRIIARLYVTDKSKGKISIPLVPYLVVGYFQLKNEKEVLNIKNEYVFSTEKFYHQFEILDVKEGGYIEFLINPKFDFIHLNNSNTIKYNNPQIVIKERFSQVEDYYLFGDEGVLFDYLADNQYKKFVNTLSVKSYKNLDQKTIEELYIDYLHLDTTLNNEKKHHFAEKLKEEYNSIFNEKTFDETIIQKYYPLRACLNFIQ